MQNIEDYKDLIRAKGYRLTPQRQFVFDTLLAHNRHMSATELVEAVQQITPAINRATVYRTLDFLHQLQLVTVTEIGKEKVYEVLTDEPHHHLVCRHCGTVY